jgi:hypothetical protein
MKFNEDSRVKIPRALKITTPAKLELKLFQRR